MPDYCFVCFNRIIPEMGWNDLIARVKKRVICTNCKENWIEIKGETCSICDRPFVQLEARFIEGDCCYDCVRWEEDPVWRGCLAKNHSLYHYNDTLQEIIARYKFRGDYILAQLFTEGLMAKLSGQEYDWLVPIPLSAERLQERGFNQAEALIIEAGLPPTNILTRVHSEKQSKKSRQERIHAEQVFQIASLTTSSVPFRTSTIHPQQPTVQNIQGKKIILIDDIYTTGSTLRHAAKLLIQHGADYVTSITIARG